MNPQPAPTGESRRESGLSRPQPAGERWRHAFGLASAYWTSKEWKFAWATLIVLIAIQFGTPYIFVLSNRWQQSFYDSLQQRESARFAALLVAFVGIMAMQVLGSVIQSYFEMSLNIRWRAFLTDRYLGRWLSRNRYAEIERLRLIDNPDQRIAQDIADITGAGMIHNGGLLSLFLGLISSTVGAISFGMILYDSAEPIRFTLFGHALSIPGSTIIYAIAYTLIGSVAINWIGRPFIRARMRQQHYEADFRSHLIHVRRNAAQIGFAGTAGTEEAGLRQTFGSVRHNFRSVIYSTLGVNVGQGVYDRIGFMLPLLLMVPRYFAGAATFGQVMASRDAFNNLTGYLSYFVQMFEYVGRQVANLNRLKGLDDAIDHERPRGIGFSLGVPTDVAIAAKRLHIVRPHGAPLLDVADWTVRTGERWVVEGPSGAGKSTLLRALAGLWPDGRGTVAMTGEGTVMLVPQRLYLPLGTLKAAICFPDAPEAHDDAAILALLERVRLAEHAEHLHAVRVWQEELSPGEQQRIALARILLHRPTLLVLDEATSALDPDNARHFHECLLDAVPDVTLVSVVHDDRLACYHTHRLTIAEGRAAATEIGTEA